MAAPVKHYKIRHKETGLFQLGGCDLRWSKKGKVWTGMGPLKAHLALFNHWRSGKLRPECDINNWEVVELEVVMSPTATIDVITLLGLT